MLAMSQTTHFFSRWRKGLPLRYTVAIVMVLGVTSPALLLLAVEQQLAQKSQRALLAQAETSLLAMGVASVAEPLWVVNHGAVDEAAERLLENPLVVAVRIDEGLASEQGVVRTRNGYGLPLDAETAAGRLNRRADKVQRSGESLGTVTVWFDATFGDSLLQQRRSQMLWLVAAQVLASLAVLMPLLVSRILKPVERLKAQASALLERSPPLTQAASVWTRNDELGMLGRHLVQVRAQLGALFGQLESKNAQLEQLALYDHLTNLPNRTLFVDLVQREIQQAHRSQQRFGIMFIDLDRFKAVNDSMGHAAGDAVLVEVSRRLRNSVREVDVVGRQSGDEFLVLARDVAHWEGLGEVADRILRAVELPVAIGASFARVSASIGIALYPDDAGEYEALLKNADIAMYQAKALGRARYSFFHAELNTQLKANLELEHDLSAAIATNQLVMHYQPQLDAQTGALVGVEALVRWQHPKHGLLYPGAFIGMAEECGKISDMGVWTLRESCRQMAQWKARGLNVGVMAVNVSALEFRDHRLLDSVQAALAESGIAPEDLEVEITESVLMQETDTSQRIIERLRALGVGIAIDDFGTGYSSLAYLKRLKPNQLKIDRSFVSDAATDSDSRAIVKGVVGLANALGLNVVAEGVETQEQLQFLRDSGCHTLQGYFLGRPVTVEQLEAWMARRDPGTNPFV
jgi:diguanylate cyclase (GGDEF)-like protein